MLVKTWDVQTRDRVRKLYLIDQDEATRSAGEGGREKQRAERDKLGLRSEEGGRLGP